MSTTLDFLFLVAVGIIWFMIGYQYLLTLAGYLLFRRTRRERALLVVDGDDLPSVTILVPAHNEEAVITGTVESLLELDYPSDRLDIMVIDDASTDQTPAILDRLAAEHARVRVLHRVPPEGGQGKSAALNAAVKRTEAEIIAIYDADNRPEPNALKLLIRELVCRPELAAALGKFRCANRHRNLLTRFINIEGLSFQWILQAGRWQMLGISTLPGTNFVIRRRVLEQLGGWDLEALTEDSELSIRIYQAGHKIAFVPDSVTWEQEPETLKVWMKQRTRWVRGNNYVIAKFLHTLLRSRSKVLAFEMLYTLSLYYLFLVAILISDGIFLLGLFNIRVVSVYGPYTTVWVIALLLYLLEIRLALSYDGEDSIGNLLASLVMYFTYCQAWLIVIFRAFWADFVRREKRTWDKTVRFNSEYVAGQKVKEKTRV